LGEKHPPIRGVDNFILILVNKSYEILEIKTRIYLKSKISNAWGM